MLGMSRKAFRYFTKRQWVYVAFYAAIAMLVLFLEVFNIIGTGKSKSTTVPTTSGTGTPNGLGLSQLDINGTHSTVPGAAAGGGVNGKTSHYVNPVVAKFYSKNRLKNPSSGDIGYPRRICNCADLHHGFQRSQADTGQNLTSTCSKEASMYGPGQKVRSYSLFVRQSTDVSKYADPLPRLLLNTEEVAYPDWVSRVYTDIPAGSAWSCGLICRYSNLFWCDITEIPKFGNLSEVNGETWRYLPLADPTVDIFVSRDIDARLQRREKVVVTDWESSKLPYHTIRDHRRHRAGMMSGLWGAKTSMLTDLYKKGLIHKLLNDGNGHPRKAWDPQLVNKIVYEPNSKLTLAHDSYFCGDFPDGETRPFPVQRIRNQVVGGMNLYRPNVCPKRCRPDYGKHWEYC